MSEINVWSDDWDAGDDWSGGGGKSRRLPRGEELGATVYELDPGNFAVYHFHHASEELLVVLRGRPTLRTAEGERQLQEGEVVHFPVGPEGVHGFLNHTDGPVRYMMASTLHSPEVAEYPDLKQIAAHARTGSQTGKRLWLVHNVQEER